MNLLAPLNDLVAWIRRAFKRTPPRHRELTYVTYAVADTMLRAGEGWRLAKKEEDRNRNIGMVYLERYVDL